MPIIVPDYVPYLLAVLGLLFMWQLHHMQVVAGRIEAKNFWDSSGVRLFIHTTPIDEQTCPACREVNGTAILPSLAAKNNFSLVHGQCTNPDGCRCLLIGLHGGWPQAQRLLSYVMTSTNKRVRLSNDKFAALLKNPTPQAPNKPSDKVAIYMLDAMRAEGSDDATAVKNYQLVVNEAKTSRERPLVLPAYMRMLDLLERSQRAKEALELLESFEKRYATSKNGKDGPSAAQREMLSLRKTRLTAAVLQPH